MKNARTISLFAALFLAIPFFWACGETDPNDEVAAMVEELNSIHLDRVNPINVYLGYRGMPNILLALPQVTDLNEILNIDVGNPVRAQVAVDSSGKIFLSCGAGLCVFSNNGQLLFRFYFAPTGGQAVGDANTRPILLPGGDVIFYNPTIGMVGRINSAGNAIWAKEELTGLESNGGASPILTADGRILVPFGDGLRSYNADGYEVWFAPTNMRPVLATPLIGSNGKVFVNALMRDLDDPMAAQILGIDVGSGTSSWTRSFSYQEVRPLPEATLVQMKDGRLLVAAHGYLMAVNSASGKTDPFAYKAGDTTLIYSTPVVGENGDVYAGSGESRIRAFLPDSTDKWEFTLGSNDYDWSASISGLVVTKSGNEEILIASSKNGYVFGISAETGTPLWRFNAGATVASPVTMSGSKMYVGDVSGKLHVVNVP